MLAMSEDSAQTRLSKPPGSMIAQTTHKQYMYNVDILSHLHVLGLAFAVGLAFTLQH